MVVQWCVGELKKLDDRQLSNPRITTTTTCVFVRPERLCNIIANPSIDEGADCLCWDWGNIRGSLYYLFVVGLCVVASNLLDSGFSFGMIAS